MIWNTPMGTTWRDIEGEPMDVCEKCQEQFSDWRGKGICDECWTPPEDLEQE